MSTEMPKLFPAFVLALLVGAPAVYAQEAAPKPEAPPRPVNGESAPKAAPAKTAAPTKATPRRTALTSRVVVKVVHPTEVRKIVIAQAEALGGFPILVTDSRIQLKVPPRGLNAMLATVDGQGFVVDKQLERKDLTQRIAQLEGQMRSKAAILKKLRTFFDDSTVQATLQIERNMTQLVTEIESVKGELRVARERARWAVVDVSFQFRRRDRIQSVESPFDWLNTVDLDRFLRNF